MVKQRGKPSLPRLPRPALRPLRKLQDFRARRRSPLHVLRDRLHLVVEREVLGTEKRYSSGVTSSDACGGAHFLVGVLASEPGERDASVHHQLGRRQRARRSPRASASAFPAVRGLRSLCSRRIFAAIRLPAARRFAATTLRTTITGSGTFIPALSHPALIVLTSTPTLLTSISTLSPGFIHTGGLRRAPTPPGVPVTIASPGSRVVKVEM